MEQYENVMNSKIQKECNLCHDDIKILTNTTFNTFSKRKYNQRKHIILDLDNTLINSLTPDENEIVPNQIKGIFLMRKWTSII